MYDRDLSISNNIVVALAAFGFLKVLEGILFRPRPVVVLLDGDASTALREFLAEDDTE